MNNSLNSLFALSKYVNTATSAKVSVLVSISKNTRKPRGTTRKHAKNCSNSTCLQRCRSLTILACLHCCVRNLRNLDKFSANSNLQSSRSSKVIDIGVNRKRICNFLLVVNSNFGRISCSFWDIDTFSYKIACIPPPHHCLTPPSGGTLCTVNIIYPSLKRTFSGLQFCRRHYGSIFILLSIVAFQNREIMRNSDKIWPL